MLNVLLMVLGIGVLYLRYHYANRIRNGEKPPQIPKDMDQQVVSQSPYDAAIRNTQYMRDVMGCLAILFFVADTLLIRSAVYSWIIAGIGLLFVVGMIFYSIRNRQLLQRIRKDLFSGNGS